MKKIFLLTIFACSALWAHAQVAFLLRTAEINDLPAENFNSVDQQPEKNAAIWFENTYSATGKAILTLDQVKSGALLSAGQPAYKVLWVNVDTQGAERLTDPVFGSDVTDKIKEYVEAGGNLLLTKQASHIICKIGRMKYNDNSDYEPGWVATDYTVGGDTWTINAILGPNLVTRDARPHPIFDNLIECDVYSYKTFPLVGAVARTDNNIMWNDIYRKDKNRINNDNNIEQMREFERDWNCQMLATWGHVVNYCAPTVVEFFPDASYKGSIIAIGAAAYQWGTSNNYISNVQKLTENALNYLKQGGDTYGYYMPYTLSEVYSIDTYRPEYLSAKWFYDNYVTTGKGRFIHKEETFPSGMKVLWVHGDRINQNTGDFYNAMGGDGFKTKLKTFVEGGGNVFLSKQATRFANDIGRCSWAPSYLQTGYSDGSDVWFMVDNFVAVTGEGAEEKRNKHSHPVFRYMTDYAEHGEEGFCKWPLLNGEGTYQRSDHKYMWGEPGEVWNNTYGISNNSTDIGRLTSFETAQTCEILGGWGHTTALDGVSMVEFKPTDSYKGRVIALGLPAYQWTTSNTRIGNVQNLTKGVLQYLFVVDPRVPGCDNCFYYISE